MFEKIKKFYDEGIYKKNHVKNFVKKGVITPEEYKEITGEDYVA